MLSYRRLFANLPEFPLVPEISIRELEDQLGWRWGHTTVMHALTDVGLSVKPDRQLARTVKALNLVPGVPKGVAPTRTEAVKINHGVSDLLDGIRSAGRTDIPDLSKCHTCVADRVPVWRRHAGRPSPFRFAHA